MYFQNPPRLRETCTQYNTWLVADLSWFYASLYLLIIYLFSGLRTLFNPCPTSCKSKAYPYFLVPFFLSSMVMAAFFISTRAHLLSRLQINGKVIKSFWRKQTGEENQLSPSMLPTLKIIFDYYYIFFSI